MSAPTLHSSLTLFLRSLVGRNVSALTTQAYETDIRQFLTYLAETDITITRPDQVTRQEMTEYLSHLADQGRTGVTRARKLAAIREFFRFLEQNAIIPSSPASGISLPKKERKQRTFLRPEEFRQMLLSAAGNPRDYAMLQLFLQTGIRVSELANLTLAHLDLQARTLTVPGKGNKERTIELEKKATQALQNYVARRPDTGDDHLFLNYEGRGISRRGVNVIIDKYTALCGIEKKISAHSLRHTFATYKAEQGVSAWQLREWLGHRDIETTQIYVHMGKDAKRSRKVMEATSL